MSYASPALFISRYGLAEATQLLADEEQLLTGPLLQAAVAGSALPGANADEAAAAVQALARLERQLAICSSTMDGYLGAVVRLPLPEGHASATVLEECCLALTRCGIADDTDNATERADKCCDSWRAWLRDVAAGRVSLGIASDSGTPIVGGRVRTGTIGSAYDWSQFGRVTRGR